MATFSSRKGKVVAEREVETPADRSVGNAPQNFCGRLPAFFVKNVRDDEGYWFADKMKPNLKFNIEEAYKNAYQGYGRRLGVSIPSEYDRLST